MSGGVAIVTWTRRRRRQAGMRIFNFSIGDAFPSEGGISGQKYSEVKFGPCTDPKDPFNIENTTT